MTTATNAEHDAWDDASRAAACDASPVPSVTVVVCTYHDDRWALLCDALGSVRAQSRPADQVVLVVDHNDALLERATLAFPDVDVVANECPRGLAGARNTALTRASGDVVAFLDDDARAHPAWLAHLVAVYDDERVVGAGGAVEPAWGVTKPRWFPDEFLWVVGCSWPGLPSAVGEVRNPIGASMSFRRDAFTRAGRFTDGVGRGASDLMGCEETEFSIRLRRAVPDAVVLYVPAARVGHHVDGPRTTWRYFVSRCMSEGRSKALVAASVGSGAALASERTYTRRVLPRGVARGIGDASRGDATGLLRSAAIVAGLAVTATGYIRGRARFVRNQVDERPGADHGG